MNRSAHLEDLGRGDWDVLILGGGINGAGVARDLALRARHAGVPLRIALVEQRHFASGTSGKNSQLIHGGLRYLKYLEFALVREALHERATLLELAPHLVEPLPFLIPVYGRFDRWFYGAGLWLYDLLAGKHNIGEHRQLSRSEVLDLEPGLAAENLVSGAVFYDCRVHSARFVLENVFDAVSNGVAACNYVRAESVRRDGASLKDMLSGRCLEVRARKVVDTRGPWSREGSLRLVRGSHLVFPRINASGYAIAHFDEAGRIVFLIPWGRAGQLTLVGTTDVDHESGPDNVRISAEEVRYLSGIVEKLFPAAAQARPIAAYSSLRPLLRDESESPTSTSREHRIWEDADGVLHVAGGKYTTYRVMSEQIADSVTREIAPALAGLRLTAHAPLPASPTILELDAQVARAVREEMAQRLPDLIFVSTYWGYEQAWTAGTLEPYAREMGRHLNWDERRVEEEIELVLRILAWPQEAAR